LQAKVFVGLGNISHCYLERTCGLRKCRDGKKYERKQRGERRESHGRFASKGAGQGSGSILASGGDGFKLVVLSTRYAGNRQ